MPLTLIRAERDRIPFPGITETSTVNIHHHNYRRQPVLYGMGLLSLVPFFPVSGQYYPRVTRDGISSTLCSINKRYKYIKQT